MRSILAGLRELTIPWGAIPGQPRIVITTGLPEPLKSYSFAPDNAPPIGGILFYTGSANDDKYMFMVWAPMSAAVFEQYGIIIGTVEDGVVRELSGEHLGVSFGGFEQTWVLRLAGAIYTTRGIKTSGADEQSIVYDSRVGSFPGDFTGPNRFNITTRGDMRWDDSDGNNILTLTPHDGASPGMQLTSDPGYPIAMQFLGRDLELNTAALRLVTGLLTAVELKATASGVATLVGKLIIDNPAFRQHLELTRSGVDSVEQSPSNSHFTGSGSGHALRVIVGGANAFSANGAGLLVPGMASKQDYDATNILSLTSTSYTAAGSSVFCGFAFTGPPSGSGTLFFQVRGESNTGNQILASPHVRLGSIVGAGTTRNAPSDQYAVEVTPRHQGAAFVPLTGLTPGSPYNAVMEHRVNAGNGDIFDRRIKWIPDLA